MAGAASSTRQRSRIAPYLMILPALAYLAVFYVVPFYSLLRTSLSTMGGSIYLPKLTFAWEWANYGRALTEYKDQILRSFGYAFSATVLCLLRRHRRRRGTDAASRRLVAGPAALAAAR